MTYIVHRFVFVLCLFSSMGFGNDAPLFVSLGANCTPAGILRHFEMRDTAFPFDWMLTIDDAGFIEMLDDNFERFTNEKYLVKHPIHGSKLVHSYYHLEFTHDWNEKFWDDTSIYEEKIEKIKTKYQRRITRFQQLENFMGKVFFIRLLIPGRYYFNLRPQNYWFNYAFEKSEKEIAVELKNLSLAA